MKNLETQFRQMKILIFYDLPTTTKKNQSDMNKFRNNLIKLGFIMMQESVYVKHCYNHDWVKRTQIKIRNILPPSGDIRILIITNKQYEEIKIMKGEKGIKERYQNQESFVII